MVDCYCCTINAHWLPHCTVAVSLLLPPVWIVAFLPLVDCYHFTIFAVASLLKQLELTLPTLLLAVVASTLIDCYFWIELNSKGFGQYHLTAMLPCPFLLLLLPRCCFLLPVVCYCQYVKAIAETIYTAACSCVTINTDWWLIINQLCFWFAATATPRCAVASSTTAFAPINSFLLYFLAAWYCSCSKLWYSSFHLFCCSSRCRCHCSPLLLMLAVAPAIDFISVCYTRWLSLLIEWRVAVDSCFRCWCHM